MELADFIDNFKDQFDFEGDGPDITGETQFKELDDWDSLVALSVLALADSKYHVSLKGSDINECSTVQELFELIKSKQ